jgi:DNA-binding transcriptional regulator/RsmH inhibitor MraZ
MVLKFSKKLDKRGRIIFPIEFLEGLDKGNLFLTEYEMEVGKGGFFRYFHSTNRSYRKFNFLKVTDYKPETNSEKIYEQLNAAEPHRIGLDGSNRKKLEPRYKEHAEIKKEYVMVKLEDSKHKPYIWIWNRKKWEEFCEVSKKNYPFGPPTLRIS